jgi:hypothetical protein
VQAVPVWIFVPRLRRRETRPLRSRLRLYRARSRSTQGVVPSRTLLSSWYCNGSSPRKSSLRRRNSEAGTVSGRNILLTRSTIFGGTKRHDWISTAVSRRHILSSGNEESSRCGMSTWHILSIRFFCSNSDASGVRCARRAFCKANPLCSRNVRSFAVDDTMSPVPAWFHVLTARNGNSCELPSWNFPKSNGRNFLFSMSTGNLVGDGIVDRPTSMQRMPDGSGMPGAWFAFAVRRPFLS